MTRTFGRQNPLTGRAAAVEAVRGVHTGGGFVAETLGRLRSSGDLDGREAALATEISLGAVRHEVTIEHVLGRVATYDPRRTSPTLRAILLTGAYQCIWLDRVPVFAAVDEAVDLAHLHENKKAAGMVNAVLRRLADAIQLRRAPWQPGNARHVRVNLDEACVFNAPVLPAAETGDDIVTHLAAATGERPERFRTLARRYGVETAETVSWASQWPPAIALHRNPRKLSADEFEAILRAEYGDRADISADLAMLPVDAPLHALSLLEEGKAHVQDQTARAAADLLEVRPGERVLDLCAAPGGKSVALALAMDDRGEVLACDAVADRLDRVKTLADRMGLSCIRTHLLPPSGEVDDSLMDRFDAALVDAPCSNSGVIARRPEARLGMTREKLDSLLTLQGQLLRIAASAVRPGGRMVYSTCSIEPEENERQVEMFLCHHLRWRIDAVKLTLPQSGPRPGDWADGGYAVRMSKATW